MGRLADARKRSRRQGAAEPPRIATPAPPVGETATGAAPAPEPDLVFPAEAPAQPSRTRLALPASGLAEDILKRVDVAAIEPVVAPARPEPPAPALPTESPARIHSLSFFAAPQREEQKAVEATEHLATFFLAREEYGVDVRLVQEIIRVTEITQVPRAPEFIKGVINLRGRIIPVVDLKRKLGLGSVEATRQARIVVVQMRERLIGLLVDGASQVLRVPVSSIEPAPEEVVEVDAHYIRGVAKLEARLIILADLHRILSVELREGSNEGSR